MILSLKTKKELRVDEIVDQRISLTEVKLVTKPTDKANKPFEWLDKHIEVWYNIHYTRPARVVREVGQVITSMINLMYDDQKQREAAKAYSERYLTQMILSRTKLEDQLQRVENERALTTNPKRLKELNKTFKALKDARTKELVRVGTTRETDRIRYGSM